MQKFTPRPFRLDTKRKKQIINYCLVMNYQFDDYSFPYPIIRKDDKFVYVSIIGGILYFIFIDEENNYTPVFVAMDNSLRDFHGFINLSELNIIQYVNKATDKTKKLYNFLFGIFYLENYEFRTN